MKLQSLQFIDHKILGNLKLDFCDQNGKPVDTVILAGENGTGKSTVLNELYNIFTYQNTPLSVIVQYIDGNNKIKLDYHPNNSGDLYVRSNSFNDEFVLSSVFQRKVHFTCIFSDVEINFHTVPISNVTSLELDTSKASQRSSSDMTKQIQQLIIDIAALDDAAISRKVRENLGKGITVSDEFISGRMDRFWRAFKIMFNDLEYECVENINNTKRIVFRRGGKRIFLDDFSSGEKQIVYRGGFLLRNINALNGAIVLIDEPEISMHPEWQNKIMEYYKSIFTDSNGVQTSQIIAVTHSPFVIHNDMRCNDKVIILAKNPDGATIVLDKPEYYICTAKQAVSDAFHFSWPSPQGNAVFLEGETDEKYLNRAIEVYGYKNVNFRFKWIGHIGSEGQREVTGKTYLDKACQISISAKYTFEQVFLYDCDANKESTDKDKTHVRSFPNFGNKRYEIGIENALVLDDIQNNDLDRFYTENPKKDKYGAVSTIRMLNKTALCDWICSLKKPDLEKVFIHLKDMIDEIIKIVK
jgi:ABC-type cobalamin/Fe3+-siderophores transport system ATPase subunit